MFTLATSLLTYQLGLWVFPVLLGHFRGHRNEEEGLESKSHFTSTTYYFGSFAKVIQPLLALVSLTTKAENNNLCPVALQGLSEIMKVECRGA